MIYNCSSFAYIYMLLSFFVELYVCNCLDSCFNLVYYDVKPAYTFGKISENASILFKKKDTFQFISLCSQENCENAFGLLSVFIPVYFSRSQTFACKIIWLILHKNYRTLDRNISRHVWLSSSTLHQVSVMSKCDHLCFSRISVV